MTEKSQIRRTRRGSGAITLIDVAKLAEVAPITASRALNTPSQVSADVLQRVKEAVERTGYVPNRMAGGLASSKSRMIAAIVPSAVSPVFMETIETLNSTLLDSDYMLMLGQSGYSVEREEKLIESFIGRRPDGIFLTGVLHSGNGRKKLLASGIPILETWDLTTTPMDMLIGFSHSEIGRAVAKFMLKKGRTKVAVIAADDERAARRHKAFREELKLAGVTDVPIVSIGASRSRTLGEGSRAFRRLLEQHPGVQAVFCSSDLLALGVLTEARVRGIRVPEDLAIVGFGDVPYLTDMVPSLTTVRINGGQIGSLAAQYLIKRAEGEEVESRIVDIGFTIVERDTA